jgi:transposase
VERYAGHCRCCAGVTLAPVPVGMEESSPFSTNIVALAIYLRFTHAISYRRLNQLFLHLYALQISEGALGCDVAAGQAMFRQRGRGYSRPAAPLADRLLR